MKHSSFSDSMKSLCTSKIKPDKVSHTLVPSSKMCGNRFHQQRFLPSHLFGCDLFLNKWRQVMKMKMIIYLETKDCISPCVSCPWAIAPIHTRDSSPVSLFSFLISLHPSCSEPLINTSVKAGLMPYSPSMFCNGVGDRRLYIYCDRNCISLENEDSESTEMSISYFLVCVS